MKASQLGKLTRTLTAVLAWVPHVAFACPACAGRGGFNLHTAVILAAMISVPFLIAAAVLQVVRRIEADPRR